MMTFESNIAYTLRFMIDHEVSRAPRSKSVEGGRGEADNA